MAQRRAAGETEPAAPEDFPEDGVELFDKQGQAYTARTAVEYTSLVFGQGYSKDKPKNADPEPEVPQTPTG